MSNSTIRIVIADESPIFRLGVRTLLAAESRLELVGEAEEGEQALALVAALHPDILLLNLHVPRINGLEVLRRLAATDAHTRTIVLATDIERAQVRLAVARGAWGVLLKHTATDMLTKCVRRVMGGEYWVGRDLVGDLVEAIRHPQKRVDAPGGLTGREQEIVARIVTGDSNKEIAWHLGLGEQTVKNHLRKIFAKLQVDNRVELALMAVEQGLVNAPDPDRRFPEPKAQTSKA